MTEYDNDMITGPEDEKKETGMARFLIKFLGGIFVLFVLLIVIYQGCEGIHDRPGDRWDNLDDVSRPQYQPDDYGVVIKVFDGDTVLLADGRKVRYLGIDTPETAKPFLGIMEGDPYAEEAKELNKEWVLGRNVGLIFGPKRRDHYGRLLAFVVVDDICVNAELLRHGLARLFMIGDYFRFKDWFYKAEQSAREKKWGIWSGE